MLSQIAQHNWEWTWELLIFCYRQSNKGESDTVSLFVCIWYQSSYSSLDFIIYLFIVISKSFIIIIAYLHDYFRYIKILNKFKCQYTLYDFNGE